MVVALTINNILRNHIDKIYSFYVDKMKADPLISKDEINPYDLYKLFKKTKEPVIPLSTSDDDEFIERVPDEKFKVYDIYKSIYFEHSFEIFCRCNEVETGFIKKLGKLKNVEILLVSTESPQSKLATLLFLSNSGFDLNHISFIGNKVKDIKKLKYDFLITDNPKYLKVKGKNYRRKLVKLNKPYNNDIDTDKTVYNHEEIITFIETLK